MAEDNNYQEMRLMNDLTDFDTPVDHAILFGDDAEEIKEPTQEESVAAVNQADSEAEEHGADQAGQVSEGEKPTRSQSIPRDRFDEVNGKFKEVKEENARLMARLAEIEASQNATPEKAKSLRDMEKEYIALFMDGDEDKALDIRDKINAETIKIAQEEAERKILERELEKNNLAQNQEFEATVLSLINEFPVLDINGEAADTDLIDAVVGLRDVYIARGMLAHEALDLAARKMMGRSGSVVGGKNQVTAPDQRRAEAIKRGVDTSTRQPPMPVGVGNRSMPTTMIPDNQDEWDSLPSKERERMLV